MQDTKLRCPSCGYNLTALTTPKCPECGKDFVLNTSAGPDFRQRDHLHLQIFLFFAAAITSIGSFVIVSGGYGADAGVSGNSAGGAACGLWIAFAIIRVWGEPKGSKD